MEEDTLLNEIEAQLEDYFREHRAIVRNPSESAHIWRQNLQCYLMIKIARQLDMVNTNLIDVEDEVSKLNPEYK